MSGESWGELAAAAVALAVMALAATVEATAGLVGRARLRQLAEARGRPRSVQGLLDPRRTLVASLLLVQAIAIAAAASLLTTVLRRELGNGEHVVSVVVVAAVFLLLGQAVPRALALSRPERTAGLLIGLAGLLALPVRPLERLVEGAARGIVRLLPGEAEPAPPVGTEEELQLVLEGREDGVIEAEEGEMISAVLRLEETRARDIMVPRVDLVAVEVSATTREVVATITAAGHSRLPVYRESIDQIVGVLYAKDLLPYVVGTTGELPLADLVRPAFIVPEQKRVDELLRELRRDKVHIAIVVDEYGGTAGLLTIEDILEEIVGEIEDEHDPEEAPLLERVGPGELIADGRLPIEDAAEELGLALDDDDDYGTVAGFVHRHLGRLPREGDRVEAEGLRAEVLAVEGRRIRRLRLTSLATRAADPDAPAAPDAATGLDASVGGADETAAAPPTPETPDPAPRTP